MDRRFNLRYWASAYYPLAPVTTKPLKQSPERRESMLRVPFLRGQFIRPALSLVLRLIRLG